MGFSNEDQILIENFETQCIYTHKDTQGQNKGCIAEGSDEEMKSLSADSTRRNGANKVDKVIFQYKKNFTSAENCCLDDRWLHFSIKNVICNLDISSNQTIPHKFLTGQFAQDI